MNINDIEIRTVNAMRYIAPLREGGSLPALAEADDDFKYVIKFRGAGHGTKMLISEFIGGMVAKVLDFRTPEIVFVQLDEAFGRSEGDEEIQDLLQGSKGLNIGIQFLTSALTFDPLVNIVDEETATKLVWLDAYLTNIDRTVKNTNLLMFHKELWLIDEGASLYFHHSWGDWHKAALSTFPMIKDHVMLAQMGDLKAVDEKFKQILTPEVLTKIVDLIPEEWFDWDTEEQSKSEIKEIYQKFLIERLSHSDNFINEAIHARETLI